MFRRSQTYRCREKATRKHFLSFSWKKINCESKTSSFYENEPTYVAEKKSIHHNHLIFGILYNNYSSVIYETRYCDPADRYAYVVFKHVEGNLEGAGHEETQLKNVDCFQVDLIFL